MILPVPHFLQEQQTTCVPAAVRMVLAYWGIEIAELELSAFLESQKSGTGVINIDLLATRLNVSISSGALAS